VTSTTLAQYVAQAVEAATQGVVPYPQKAEHKLDIEAPILFTSASRPISRRVTIGFPAGFAGAVVLRSSASAALGTWEAGVGPWVLELPDGYYEVEPVAPGGPTDWLFKVVGADVDVQL
jgi:hypothetical protein